MKDTVLRYTLLSQYRCVELTNDYAYDALLMTVHRVEYSTHVW